jgi:two-component system response regulator TctD
MSYKALLVEDDDDTRRALAAILRHKGFNVCAVATVRDALKSLDGQVVAVLDINLPDGLGTDVLSAIREQARPIEVAMWTASLTPRLIERATSLRPEAIFIKPDHLNDLLAWLDARAPGAGHPAPAPHA